MAPLDTPTPDELAERRILRSLEASPLYAGALPLFVPDFEPTALRRLVAAGRVERVGDTYQLPEVPK